MEGIGTTSRNQDNPKRYQNFRIRTIPKLEARVISIIFTESNKIKIYPTRSQTSAKKTIKSNKDICDDKGWR